MRKSLLAVAALVAAPLFAGDSGWFVSADAMIGDQTGNDTVLASTTDAVGTNPNGIVRIEMDAKVSPRLTFGRKTGMGTWGASFSTHKAEGSASAYQANGYLLASFGSPWNDQYRFHYISGRQEAKGHTFDLFFSREIAKIEKSSFHWAVGLRHWKLENTFMANGCENDGSGVSCNNQGNNGAPYTNDQTVYREVSDSTGLGLTLAIKGRYEFTDRVSASSWVRFGVLKGKTDLEVRDEAYYGPGAATRCDNIYSYCSDMSTDAKRTFQQTEVGGKFDFSIWNGLSAYVGYVFSSTGDAVTSLDYTINGGYGYGPALRTKNVGNNGFLVGAKWNF